MRIRYAGSTHVGMKRTHNEDNFFLLAEENLFIVADGMGGHSSGEVASQIAVECLTNFFIETSRDKEKTWPHKEDRRLTYDENRLAAGIKLSNRRVYELAQSDSRYKGMGTTLVSLLCAPSGVFMGHVGDSRGYIVRGRTITQITEDHSLLNDYLKVHRLTSEEIANFPHKNVIVRALGMKDVVNVDVHRLSPRPGDVYLLCSDGLSNMVPDATIMSTVAQGGSDLEKTCQELVAQANAQGGLDNVTVVLVRFDD